MDPGLNSLHLKHSPPHKRRMVSLWRKVHVYFLSPVHAFLPSLFGLFAFSPASALRTRKVHVYFLSAVHALLPSLFGLFAFFLESALRTRKVHVAFPSTFPVRSICFLSQALQERGRFMWYFLSPVHAFLPSLFGLTIILPFLCPKSTSSKSGRLQDRRFDSNRVESSRFDQLSALPVSQIDFLLVESSTTQTIRVESPLL